MEQYFEKRALRSAKAMVGLAGITCACIAEDGTVKWSVGYHAGVHFIDGLAAYMGATDQLQIVGECTVLTGSAGRQAERVRAVRHPLQNELGANPMFQPAYDESERAARMLLRKVAQRSDALERRLAAFERAAQLATESVDQPLIDEQAASGDQEAASDQQVAQDAAVTHGT